MRALDLTGQRFGLLTVTGLFRAGSTKGGNPKRTWWCQCDCGRRLIVIGQNLRSGNTRSCGCERARLTAERNRARAGKPRRRRDG